jgi:hypothetical protein
LNGDRSKFAFTISKKGNRGPFPAILVVSAIFPDDVSPRTSVNNVTRQVVVDLLRNFDWRRREILTQARQQLSVRGEDALLRQVLRV